MTLAAYDVVSQTGISKRLGVARVTVKKWIREDRYNFPLPDLIVDNRPLWDWERVVLWVRQTDREHLLP